jgi:hypothetical protein
MDEATLKKIDFFQRVLLGKRFMMHNVREVHLDNDCFVVLFENSKNNLWVSVVEKLIHDDIYDFIYNYFGSLPYKIKVKVDAYKLN